MDSCWAVLDSCLKMLQTHKHGEKYKQASSSSSYSVFWPVLSHSCASCVMRAAMLTPAFVSATFLTLCSMLPAQAKQTNVQRGVQRVLFQPFFESWLRTEQVGKPFSSAGFQISSQDLAAVQLWAVSPSTPGGSDVSFPLLSPPSIFVIF